MVSLSRVVVLVVAAAWTAPAFAADERVTDESAITQGISGQPGTQTEIQQFQDRENQAQQLEQFEGGDDGIYIGSGVLVLALIVLIVVLLVR